MLDDNRYIILGEKGNSFTCQRWAISWFQETYFRARWLREHYSHSKRLEPFRFHMWSLAVGPSKSLLWGLFSATLHLWAWQK
jgi:hypothetical protein